MRTKIGDVVFVSKPTGRLVNECKEEGIDPTSIVGTIVAKVDRWSLLDIDGRASLWVLGQEVSKYDEKLYKKERLLNSIKRIEKRHLTK